MKFKKNVLKHPVRKQIVDLLSNKEMSVSEITNTIDRSQPYTSLQLGILRDNDIVESKVKGQKRIYTLINKNIQQCQN